MNSNSFIRVQKNYFLTFEFKSDFATLVFSTFIAHR